LRKKLFRDKALEEQGNRLAGDVLLVTSPSSWLILFYYAVALVFIVIFLATKTYVRKEIALGKLSRDLGVVTVVSSGDGIVEKLHVVEQEQVEKGGVIATLSNKRSISTAVNLAGDMLAIESPVNGRLELLAVASGQTVSANQQLAIIVPSQSKLYAEVFIPSKAAGYIEPGQRIRLKFHAYPDARFSVGLGTIVNVSQTVLYPEEISVPIAAQSGLVFRAYAEIESPNVVAEGREFPLRDGMLFWAEIETDEKTLMQWLLTALFTPSR
jgi:membrane fusion protein